MPQGPRTPPPTPSQAPDEKNDVVMAVSSVEVPVVFRAPPGSPKPRPSTTTSIPTSTPVPANPAQGFTIRVLPTVSQPSLSVAMSDVSVHSNTQPSPPVPIVNVPRPAVSVSRPAPSGRGTNQRPPDPNSRRSLQRRNTPIVTPAPSPVAAMSEISQVLEESMRPYMPGTPVIPEPVAPPGYAASVNNQTQPLIIPANRTSARGGPTRDLPCLLSPSQLDYLTTHYPGVTFISARRENIPHSHPLLALERKWCEEYVVLQASLLGTVVDIGGNASRHHNANDRVWSCCPILSAEDATRNYRYQGLPGWCDHKFQDCHCVVPDAYIAVHSLYYLGPQLVCRAVNSARRKVMWSAHHMFDRAYGSFAMGEAQYQVDQSEVVTMHSTGNVTDYVHSACAWLHDGYYRSEDGTAMAWTIEKTFPNTVIMRFNAAPPDLPEPASGYRGFVPCLHDNKYFGPMRLSGAFDTGNSSSVTPQLVNQVISKFSFSSWGPSIVAMETGVTEQIVVPKDMVNTAARLMVGKPRNEASFNTLCSAMRHLVNTNDVPPDLVPKAIIIACTLGFVTNLDLERSLLTSMGQHAPSFAAFDQLLKFKFPWVIPEYFCPALSTLLISAAMRFRSYRGVRLSLFGLGLLVGVSPFVPRATRLILAAWRAPPERNEARYSEPSVGFRLPAASIFNILKPFFLALLRGLRAGFATLQTATKTDYLRMLRNVRDDVIGFVTPGNDLVPIGKPVTFPTIECHNPLLPLTTWRLDDQGALDRTKMPRVAYKGDKYYNVQPDTLKAVGLIVSEVIPVVHASSANNEMHSLHNRVANVPLSPDLDFFSTYEDYVMMNFDTIFPNHFAYDLAYDFNRWNGPSRFPPSKRLAHQLAYSEDSYLPSLIRKAVRTKAFVKLEKRLDANMVEYVEGRPRFIMGGEDAFNVVVGPWCFALGEKLSKIWSADFGIFFTGGSNTEDIGRWFTQLGHNNPAYYDCDADFKSFDSTQFYELMKFEIRINVKLGLPQYVGKFMILAINHRGATPHGVVYFLYDGRNSGGPNTMTGNSIVNGTSKVFSIQCANPQLSTQQILDGVKLAVIGDDGLDRLNRSLKRNYDQYLKRLGLNSVITPRPDSRFLEYCSCRFWPTTDGHVLGRKIGLAIPKCGYYIHQSDRRILGVHKSSLIGELLNSHFIPPYRSIVEAQLRLLKGVRALRLTNDKSGLRLKTLAKHESTEDTWQMLAVVYNWTKVDQDRLDCALSRLTTLPSILPGHLVEKLIARDSDLPSWAGMVGSIWHSYDWPLNPRSPKGVEFAKQWAQVNDNIRASAPALSKSEKPYLDMVNVCYVSPIWEECFKRIVWKGWPVGLLLPITEMGVSVVSNVNLSDRDFEQLLFRRTVTMVMHYLWYLMPLKWGITCHSLWNMVAMGNPSALGSIIF